MFDAAFELLELRGNPHLSASLCLSRKKWSTPQRAPSEPSASIMLIDSENATCVSPCSRNHSIIIPFANSVPATREGLEDMMHMHADFEADAGSRYR